MGNHRSAGSFCSLVVASVLGTSDSVQSLLLATYGDGAEVYCVANLATYRMDGAAIGQPTVGDSLVAPASGNGVWVKQGASADLAQNVIGTAAFHVAPITGVTASTWVALPSGALFYAHTTSSLFWTLNTTTGVLTYIGPNALVLLNAVFSVFYDLATPQTIEIDLSGNGALIGGTTTTTSASSVTTQGIANAATQLTYNAIFQATTNSTYQIVFRDTSTPLGTFTVNKYQVMITAQV
jgi:hypothetical protein